MSAATEPAEPTVVAIARLAARWHVFAESPLVHRPSIDHHYAAFVAALAARDAAVAVRVRAEVAREIADELNWNAAECDEQEAALDAAVWRQAAPDQKGASE